VQKGKVSTMRYPLWLLNSALLLLLLLALLISIATQEKPPRWVSIEVIPSTKTIKKDASKIEINKIYTNDLFDTYRTPTPEGRKPLELMLPTPPTAVTAYVPASVPPIFLDPLPLTLKGIIIIGNDQKNRALIENTKTKEERTVKIGDVIEDAIVVIIFKNRIMLIRSNGQTETLYLREGDAKAALLSQSSERWAGIVKLIDDTTFAIDPEAFKEIVSTLGQLIDMLNATTVYNHGKPWGIRIGILDPGSLGLAIGLMSGDIITALNDMPISDQASRISIYQALSSLPVHATINIALQRQGISATITIKLEELAKPSLVTLGHEGTLTRHKTKDDIEEEKIDLLEKKYTFAPTLQEIRERENKEILTKVKKAEYEHHAQQRPTKFEI
jgi:type II secretory pathway component PulC